MERRFRIRLDELLDDAVVADNLVRGLMPRLESFLQPFVAALQTAEQRTNAQQYVSGLLSDLKSKDVESIAYLHDRERQGLQKFVGQSPWDHQPLLTELTRAGGNRVGRSRWCVGFRSVGLCQEGDGVGGCPTAVVRAARENRELPGRHLPGVRVASGPRLGRLFGFTCRRNGRGGSGGVRRPEFPKTIRFRTRP